MLETILKKRLILASKAANIQQKLIGPAKSQCERLILLPVSALLVVSRMPINLTLPAADIE
jgi:hypothetical protein